MPPEPPEVRDHWRLALAQYLARRERTRKLRAELAAARTAGLEARHRTKLRRARVGNTTTKETP